MHRLPILLAIALAIAPPLWADSDTARPYAGQQARDVAALSPDDMADLAAGAGWGLALPAELNGVPGPTHLLELAEEVALSADQISQLTALRERMRRDAIAAGQAFIAAERELDRAFADGVPDQATLDRLVAEAGAARATLRLVHLSAHLETQPLLHPDQIARYNQLRGYADDPCASVPDGHDPAMWRQHNGCN